MSPADDQQRPDDAPRLWTPTFWAAVVAMFGVSMVFITAMRRRSAPAWPPVCSAGYTGMYLALAATGLVSVGLYWLVHGRSAASPGHQPS